MFQLFRIFIHSGAHTQNSRGAETFISAPRLFLDASVGSSRRLTETGIPAPPEDPESAAYARRRETGYAARRGSPGTQRFSLPRSPKPRAQAGSPWRLTAGSGPVKGRRPPSRSLRRRRSRGSRPTARRPLGPSSRRLPRTWPPGRGRSPGIAGRWSGRRSAPRRPPEPPGCPAEGRAAGDCRSRADSPCGR